MSSGENPHAREADDEPAIIPPVAPQPAITPPGPPPPAGDADGVDPELASKTNAELEAHIRALRAALDRPQSSSSRLDCRLRLAMASTLLRERQGPSVAITPRVPALVPKAPPPAPPPPRPSVYALADRLHRGVAGTAPVEELARRLAQDFDDEGWLDKHRKTARQIRAGEVDPKRVSEGHRCAISSPDVRKRGAVFNAYVFRRE